MLVTYSISLAFCSTGWGETRTWTSRDGRTFDGEFVSLRDSNATIRREEDGRSFTISIATLGAADRRFIADAEIARLSGTWVIEESLLDDVPYDCAGDLHIEGKTFRWRFLGKDRTGAVRLNLANNPQQIYLHAPKKRFMNSWTFRGIYKFEGERCTICTGREGNRSPGSFNATPKTITLRLGRPPQGAAASEIKEPVLPPRDLKRSEMLQAFANDLDVWCDPNIELATLKDTDALIQLLHEIKALGPPIKLKQIMERVAGNPNAIGVTVVCYRFDVATLRDKLGKPDRIENVRRTVGTNPSVTLDEWHYYDRWRFGSNGVSVHAVSVDLSKHR